MTDDKYAFLEDGEAVFFGKRLQRIVALKSFEIPAGRFSGVGQTYYSGVRIKKGDVGGYVEGAWNLSQDGCCWIGRGAAVFGKANVSGDAYVHGVENRAAPTVTVRGTSRIFGRCEIKDHAQIRDGACVGGCSVIRQYARVEDFVNVIDADIGGYVCLAGDYLVRGSDKILDYNARPVRIFDQRDLRDALISVNNARERSLSVSA